MRRLVLSMLVLAAIVTPAAAVPAHVPIQGYLTDTSSMPVNGSRQITFKLYDDATAQTAWYTESQVVQVEQGDFTVYLGAVTPLDLSRFRTGGAYLGITLQGEAEMSPRLELASVPFAAVAAFAQETASVPPGAVMMFDLAACPPGWTALDAARGRTIVGVPAGGELRGTVGTALGDLEDRPHAHMVDTPACAMSSAGAHSHGLTTNASTTGLGGTHGHAWSAFNIATKVWSSFTSSGTAVTVIDWPALLNDPGMDNAGGGNYPLAKDDDHFGGQTTGTFNYYTAQGGAHTHTVPSLSGLTTTINAHSHTCDPLAAPSQPATTAQAMPYLQLLVCRKD